MNQALLKQLLRRLGLIILLDKLLDYKKTVTNRIVEYVILPTVV